MVAFHYPPQCVSSGVQRTVNFVRHLPDLQWNPVVLSANERAYEVHSKAFMPDWKDDNTVVRAFALDASRHLGIGRRYPRLLALPDRWSSWWLGGTRAGKRLIRENGVDVIWSTQPIPTAHMIALSLVKWSGLPWIADFRDPIINRTPPADRLLRSALQRIESRTIALASRCVFTTEAMAAMYRQRYPQAAEKFVVIPNGYDESVFDSGHPNRFGAAPDKLLILHSGHIYPAERDPSALFKAIRSLLDRGLIDPDRLCLRFRASGSDPLLLDLAKQHGVEHVLDLASPLPYQEAINEVMAADVLLVLQGSAFNAQVPAKTYEYLRAGRPILALTDPTGDTTALLRGFLTPVCVELDNDVAITRGLEHLIARGDTAKADLAADQQASLAFSRKQQAATLAGEFGRIAGN